VVGCNLGGGLVWGRKRRNRGEESRQSVDILAFTDGSPTDTFCRYTVGNSDSECVTSLYGDPSLNLSVIPSIKTSETIPRHHTISSFQNSIDSVGDAIDIYRWTDRIADGIYSIGNYYR
jgi:hypothetical protein